MNEALKAIYERRSIRKYKPQQISREELDAASGEHVACPLPGASCDEHLDAMSLQERSQRLMAACAFGADDL